MATTVRQTCTQVACDAVQTRAAIDAGTTGTAVNGHLTLGASEDGGTEADGSVVGGVDTSASVGTPLGATAACLALISFVASRTHALKVACVVVCHTRSAMLTRVALTGILR